MTLRAGTLHIVPALFHLFRLFLSNMLRPILFVGLGGAAGSILRYILALVVNKNFSSAFPLATFLINIIGCLIIGLLFGIAEKHTWMQENLLLLLATGFCGGFTTFSTFALENFGLFEKNQSYTAIAYSLLSIVIGIILCKLGFWLAR